MKLLLLSDIHGNYPALQAVLNQVGLVDKIFCLGDVAGYFPFLNETVELLASLETLTCVMGNHDQVLLKEGLSTGSESADIAILVQRRFLKAETQHFLECLPVQVDVAVDGRLCHLFHGSLKDPVNGRDTFWESSGLPSGAYFFGHSHKPFIHSDQNRRRLIVNPGGCGLPRDGASGAAYALVDTSEWHVSFCRASYPIDEVRDRCRSVGLPDRFWKSLECGCWVRDNEHETEIP
ncbi:MAG: metallophosphoesterase family protein [Candidatus Omnitrophota bacterium]